MLALIMTMLNLRMLLLNVAKQWHFNHGLRQKLLPLLLMSWKVGSVQHSHRGIHGTKRIQLHLGLCTLHHALLTRIGSDLTFSTCCLIWGQSVLKRKLPRSDYKLGMIDKRSVSFLWGFMTDALIVFTHEIATLVMLLLSRCWDLLLLR